MGRRAVVVLGHAHLDGVLDPDGHARMATLNEHWSTLGLDDPATSLVLAGGAKSTCPVSEADQMHALITHPIAEPQLVPERFSRTTAENAWCVVDVLLRQGGAPFDEIVIVCSRAHAVRSWIFFRRAMRELGLTCRLRFCYSPTLSPKAWAYEARWLHHIPRNIAAARIRRGEMQL